MDLVAKIGKHLKETVTNSNGEEWNSKNLAYAIAGTLQRGPTTQDELIEKLLKVTYSDKGLIVALLIDNLATRSPEYLAEIYNELNPDGDSPFVISENG